MKFNEYFISVYSSIPKKKAIVLYNKESFVLFENEIISYLIPRIKPKTNKVESYIKTNGKMFWHFYFVYKNARYLSCFNFEIKNKKIITKKPFLIKNPFETLKDKRLKMFKQSLGRVEPNFKIIDTHVSWNSAYETF